MVKPQEFRLGNYLLHKTGVRILTVPCTPQHVQQMAGEGNKDLFPVALSATVLEKAGFAENKQYPLLPASREFVLLLPVMGGGEVAVKAYVKNNKECFARAMLNNVPVSNNLQHLHQLQNLVFALTGEELSIRL